MMEKKETVKKIGKYAPVALEIETKDGKYELSQPDERNLRFMIRDGIRERFISGLCKIEEDVCVGQPLILRLSSTNRFFPGYRINKGKVKQIKTFEGITEQYLLDHAEKGGRGLRRDWIKSCGIRHPEHFEEYREIYLKQSVSALHGWFQSAGCYLGGEDQRWEICEMLMRTVSALLDYYPVDGTDYIEGKLSTALRGLGYELTSCSENEQYCRILTTLPIETSSVLDLKYHDRVHPNKVKIDGKEAWLTKWEMERIYLDPLIEALETSKDHLWDEAALLIMKAIALLMARDLQEKFESYSSQIERHLWDSVFLLGYRLIKKPAEAQQNIGKQTA